jgi:thymidylate synthase ThyX
MRVELDFRMNKKDLIESFLFCTDNHDKLEEYYNTEVTEKGNNLIRKNLIDTTKPHNQTLNQIQIVMKLYNIPRFILQEFARHRFGNEMLVKSTRWCLHKIANDERLTYDGLFDFKKIEEITKEYFYANEDDFMHETEKYNWCWERFEEIRLIKFYRDNFKASNDKLKKYINEYFFTNIKTVISATALKNILSQRLDADASPAFRELSKIIYKEVPDEWKDIFRVFKYKKINVTEESIKEILNNNQEIYIKEYLI